MHINLRHAGNVVEYQALYELGFNVYPIGKAALTHL
jgi:hypothetical protein